MECNAELGEATRASERTLLIRQFRQKSMTSAKSRGPPSDFSRAYTGNASFFVALCCTPSLETQWPARQREPSTHRGED
jgi:hypothetical protein